MEKEATYRNNLLLQYSLRDGGDQNRAARKITNGTRMMPIFISFVCHWNYPELTYYKPAAAPAMHSTEARGKHINKKPHIKYENCSFSEYKNTFCDRHVFVFWFFFTQYITWQQWLRPTGRRTTATRAAAAHHKEKGRGGLSPPFSACTAKSHACIAKYMEMECCEMRPMPGWEGTL